MRTVDIRSLPAGQGRQRNRYLKSSGNSSSPTSFTVQTKTGKVRLPRNWPQRTAEIIAENLEARGVAPLQAIIDPRIQLPTSLLLVGVQLPDAFREPGGRNVRLTRISIQMGVFYYEKFLQSVLGSSRALELNARTRSGTLFVQTNLSAAGSIHALCPPLLEGIPGIKPSHFSVYTWSKHRLGVKINCSGDGCSCKRLAEEVIPAMWLTR